MCLAPRGWSAALVPLSAIVAIALAAGCTKRNPDLCCATDAECEAIGFSSHAPCDLGVCVKNECTTTPGACDDDGDCAGNAANPFCVAGTCAACATSASCPTTAPVCDAVAHDCRACAKDSECDSLACDLGTGTCVDPANILYAAPNGTNAAPCTRVAPCSLFQASQNTDTNHPYIALLPGIHITGASFEQKTVTLAGNGATIGVVDLVNSTIFVDGGQATLRDLIFDEHTAEGNSDGLAVVLVHAATVNIDNLTSTTIHIPAIANEGDSSRITLSHGKFTNLSFDGAGKFFVDSCLMINASPVVTGSLQLTNSVLISGPTDPIVSFFPENPQVGGSLFLHNTMIGGKFTCPDPAAFFNSNILYNSAFDDTGACSYIYSLVTTSPAPKGATNFTGDPMFVDPVHGDFHLSAQSPARGAADPTTTTILRDYDGTPRPQGSRNDIGAFEYVPPAGP